MSERFNFYDVYGYLIPGFALLGLLWLPLGISSGEVPDLGFADALGGLLIAYLLGHLLAGVTATAFPAGRRVSRDDVRQPSDDMLEVAVYPNRAAYIAELQKKIKDDFGVDLGQTPPESQVREIRQRAFLLCRDRLVLQGRGAYAEQFQGMYSMMRGVSGASLVAAYYVFGWFVSIVIAQLQRNQGLGGGFSITAAWVGLVLAGLDFWLNPPGKSAGAKPQAATAGSDKRGPTTPLQWAHSWWPAVVFWLLVGSAFYAGLLLGEKNPSLNTRPGLIIALAAGAVLLAGRCHASYQLFARAFADTVYRNFLALPKNITSQEKATRHG
jgi:hypothetical protein